MYHGVPIFPSPRAFARETLKRGLATVGVIYPVSANHMSRARFGMTAMHTKEMLDHALEVIDEVGTMLWLKHSRMPRTPTFSENDADIKAR